MREYNLHVILHNIERMKKYKLITEAAYDKFRLPKSTNASVHNLPSAFKQKRKELNKKLDPEYLRFDSMIESGNLERAEAFPINHSQFEMARARHQTVVQKYNLFCKVDTNTKGH